MSQILSVSQAIDQVLKTLRSTSPGHPERAKDLSYAVTMIMELVLDREGFDIKFTESWPLFETREGAYPVPKPTLTEIGRRAFDQGLRGLRFLKNLDPREAKRVLEMLAATPSKKSRFDIVTSLWEADLRTIEIESAFPPLEHLGASQGLPFPTFSTHEEVREEIRTPLLLRASIFLLLALEQDISRKDTVLPIFNKVMEKLIRKGDIYGIVHVFRMIDRFKCFPENILGAFHESLDPYRTHEWVESMVPVMENMGNPELVAEFLFKLGHVCIPPLVKALRNPDAGSNLFDVLVHLARMETRPFREFLSNATPEEKHDLLRILSEVNDPMVREQARDLMKDQNPQTRVLCLKILSHGPIEETRPVLWKALSDPSVQVRITGARILKEKGTEEDLEPLKRIAAAKGFMKRDLLEKTAVLEAIAAIGRESAINLLRRMMEKVASYASPEKAEELRIASIKALSIIKTDEARELVSRAAREGSEALKNAGLSILQKWNST